MKKITLSCCLLFSFGISVFCQNIASQRDNSKSPSIFKVSSNQQEDLKGPRAYIFESFENTTFPPTGWTKQNPDGGTGWARITAGTTPLPGWEGGTASCPTNGGTAAVYCTWNTGGAATNDQWLITPQFAVTSGDHLTFSAFWFGGYKDSLFVLLSNTTNETTAFTTTLLDIDTLDFTAQSTWKDIDIDLTSYAGQNIYIAFREKIANNTTGGAFLSLDMIKMGVPPNVNVSITKLDVPSLILISETPYAPKATVQNLGGTSQTFDVTMTISGGYSNTQNVANLAALGTQQVSFANWSPAPGQYTITVTATVTDDSDPSDNTKTGSVEVVDGTWIKWGTGATPANGIGTNGAAVFDCVSRWVPADLTPYNNKDLVAIKFCPWTDAIFEIRAWTNGHVGPADTVPGTQVATEAVASPVLKAWNIVVLSTPVKINASQELWFGYNVNTAASYPAGVDAGPAIDWKGNVMEFGGYWTSLLSLASTLNFNWAIQGLVEGATGIETLGYESYSMYPNPAYNVVNVITNENSSIFIYNSAGALVKSIDNSPRVNTIDLNDYDAGMYLIKIITGSKIITDKINVVK